MPRKKVPKAVTAEAVIEFFMDYPVLLAEQLHQYTGVIIKRRAAKMSAELIAQGEANPPARKGKPVKTGPIPPVTEHPTFASVGMSQEAATPAPAPAAPRRRRRSRKPAVLAAPLGETNPEPAPAEVGDAEQTSFDTE